MKEEESNIMKAMILDVDGTLWDTTGVVAEAWMQAASELMIPLDTPITADRLKQEFGKPMDEIAANLFPTLSESQRALVMESCCEYEEFYLENAREPLLFDGVKETILTLSQNYAVCIVSNCQKGYIELFLKKTGLENAITDFECFGNTRLSKGENALISSAFSNVVTSAISCVLDANGSLTNDTLKSPGTFPIRLLRFASISFLRSAFLSSSISGLNFRITI